MYKDSGFNISREEAIEKSNIQRRYTMTPIKRQNDYEHAACGLKGANYEKGLVNALRGFSSPEFGGRFDSMVKMYTVEKFCVPDKYGLTEYVAALKELHDKLLKGMKRGSDSTYR